MNTVIRRQALACAALIVGAMARPAEAATPNEGKFDDPAGVLRKPIPDKLVVLTFDDGPASHATIVAPILKSLGFGGSFYVCDFDSFNTRKDWYMTWRQMKALADDGFEIGNHTKGHAGGAELVLSWIWKMSCWRTTCPKPTTVAWPLYEVDTGTYPDLAANGYTFRPGRPRPPLPADGGQSL